MLRFLLAFVSLFFVTLSTANARDSQRFILAHGMHSEHIFHSVSKKFDQKLQELTGEPSLMDYHPGGALGDWASLFEQTMMGAIPMTLTFGATEFDERINIYILSYVAKNWDQAKRLYGMDGPMMPLYDAIFTDLNMKILAPLPVGFHGIATRKGLGKVPREFPGEAKGIKVRVPPAQVAIHRFEALGFSPVPIPWSELYTALQLGAVDAQSFVPASDVWQMRDVLETYILSRDSFEHGFWLVNLEWWNRQSKSRQQQIQIAASHSVEWAWQEARSINESMVKRIKNYGIRVVDLNLTERSNIEKLLYNQEWRWMEQKVGSDLMRLLRSVVNEGELRHAR